MINVSKPYLPPINEYTKFLERIWGNSQVTNQGPLVMELEKRLAEYLQVANIHFVSSGTTALQIAIKAAVVSGEIIIPAFSHISTVNAILWTNCTPVFADINPYTFCIDTKKISAAITDKTTAILATHVYGFPCDVAEIEAIAKANNLKVIYDAAHAFDIKIDERSVFNYGDISAVSFHATKLYHTIEGGAVITNDANLAYKCRAISNFGLVQHMPTMLGINGKNSEFHAAIGLCTLQIVPQFIEKRKLLSERYKKRLSPLNLKYPEKAANVEYNYAYFPVIFPSETILLLVLAALGKSEIYPRRYFFPSINNLPYYDKFNCPIAEDASKRILCLPLYYELTIDEVDMITGIVVSVMND